MNNIEIICRDVVSRHFFISGQRQRNPHFYQKNMELFPFSPVLLLVALASPTFGQLCPPANILSPCTCSESPLSITCSEIRGEFRLKETLDEASKYVGDEVIFYSLVISGVTQLAEIEDGAVEALKFEVVRIQRNPNLGYFSPNAFNASKAVTRRLVLDENDLQNDAPRERDIFDVVNGFEKLEYLEMSWNRLSSIPESAFQNLPALTGISMISNRISSIGRRAFAGILSPNLGTIRLSSNSLPSRGLPEDAFEGLSASVTIHLECNDMTYMEQGSYQTLLDSGATVIASDGGEGACWGHTQRFHCDERSDWICDAEGRYRPKLERFLCKAQYGFRDIWEYCAGRN